MKLVLFLIIASLGIHHGNGVPKRAVYKFVRCNPEGDQTNCVTHQTEEMEWHPDLLNKLPASEAQFLKAKPVEEEEEHDNSKTEILTNEEQESPAEYGSAYYEGSATDILSEDQRFVTAESETGSGMDTMNMNWFPSKAKPEDQEMREDQLLKL